MNDVHFDPAYADAVSHELENYVQRRGPRRWRRPSWIAGGVLGAVLVLGGAAAAAASLGLLPGANVVAPLAAPVTAENTGTVTIDLGARPAGATHVSIDFRCLSAGTFTFDDGSGVTCDASGTNGLVTATIPLGSGQHAVTVYTQATSRWSISAAYVTSTTTAWAINGDGHSYGVLNHNGSPDLVAVIATNGRDGYVYAQQLAQADGSAAAETFTSPTDALRWQELMAGRRISVPVYEPDGHTQIGEFVLQY